MKVKLKDVALAAGVSVSTVSRVINGDRDKPASPETRDKIWRIVKELGYVPNLSAKKLVKGETDSNSGKGKIGCIYTSTSDIKTDPFFSCIGIGIQEEIRRQGYELAFALSAYRMAYSDIFIYLTSHPSEGIIVIGSFDDEVLEFLEKNYKYIVYAGVNSVKGDFDQVICDGYSGAITAVSHLVEAGHKRIGYVGNELHYEAYCDVIEKESMVPDEDDWVQTRLYTSDAYKAMKTYLEGRDISRLPTAFYCANDATAFGVLKAIQDMGYRIPEDIAVIGMDDVEMARFVTPTLSTVSIPRKSLGIKAVKMLVDQVDRKRDYVLKVDMPFDLKIRESS